MKKIGILTQPLHQNYGGLLQAYALQQTLKSLGYEPHIIDRNHKYENPSLIRKIASHCKTVISKFVGRKRSFSYFPTTAVKQHYAKETNYFITTYIYPKTEKIYTTKDIVSYVEKINPYALIVGSDQVWRPRYSPNLPSYFLDFAEENKKVKKISYAASFGVSNWEFSEKQKYVARRLIKNFDAVSVREDSGVELCSTYLNCKAKHVLDPTMLLDKEKYIELVKEEGEVTSKGELFAYVLDKTKSKNDFIINASDKLGLKIFEVMPKCKLTFLNARRNIDECVYPSVTKWLRAFMDAKFVITDSFHGCVFSIIFNKPFLVLGNEDRGLARFQSLLKMFDLEDRLNSDDLNPTINWEQVNEHLHRLKIDSLEFLETSLNE